MQTILIFGATSSIAQACMHVWAQQKQVHKFICVARNQEKLNSFCDDFMIRYPQVEIQCDILNFSAVNEIKAHINQYFDQHVIDQALVVQGMMYQDEIGLSVAEIEALIYLNTTSVAVSVDCLYKRMSMQNKGKIGVIGSVAGDRGRKANYLYGASKSFVATYVEGLQHRIALEKSMVTVSLIKPGPTESNMTRHLTVEGKKLAKVDVVAAQIVNGMHKGQRVIYAPFLWKIIMLIIRHLPFLIFKKLDI